MLHDIHFPEHLSGTEMDEYLEKGWYRMGQVVFTTNYIVYEELLYRVYWMRYRIKETAFTRTHRNLMRAMKQFEIKMYPLKITEEMEELYYRYRVSMPFEAPESVEHFLMDGGNGDVYDSTVIEIRDKEKLISAGIFDTGKDSIAGIMNFYDPAYRKFSPGKVMMLYKAEHAILSEKTFYYPGYIVAGNPRFDYKLFLGKAEAEIFFPEVSMWLPYEKYWPGL